MTTKQDKHIASHRSGCSAWTRNHPQTWVAGDEVTCDCGAAPKQADLAAEIVQCLRARQSEWGEGFGMDLKAAAEIVRACLQPNGDYWIPRPVFEQQMRDAVQAASSSAIPVAIIRSVISGMKRSVGNGFAVQHGGLDHVYASTLDEYADELSALCDAADTRAAVEPDPKTSAGKGGNG